MKKISSIIFALIAGVTLLSGCGKTPVAATSGTLSGFEDKKTWDISPESGFDISLSKENVKEGKFSLKVVYPVGSLPSINTKKLRKDWGNYDSLKMDIFNPRNEEIPFAVRIDDVNGKRANIDYPLKPGWNGVKIERREIAGYIDPGSIKRVVLYLKYPKNRVTLFFDNMRLEGSGDLLNEGMTKEKIEELRSGFIKNETFKPMVPSNPFPVKGVIKCSATKFYAPSGNDVLVSSTIPFAPGQVFDENEIAIFDNNSVAVPVALKVLARWDHDRSIKVVLVQFKADIEHNYKVFYLKWGEKSGLKHEEVADVHGYPGGILLLPKQWMCLTGIAGPQVPFGENAFPEYDNDIVKNFIRLFGTPIEDFSTQGYYDVIHVLYQLYARTGEDIYFKVARREALKYRDRIIKDEPLRGRYADRGQTRFIYVQGMIDDYLFTGDEESFITAGYMAEYLKNKYNSEKAYFKRNDTKFWTEREAAFPLIGIMSWYELTGDKEYLRAAGEIVNNLYRTQKEWPERGGFIHNLYSHDPEEGARRDEYGGSPFMTGLLLEGIIKYHQMTGSNVAKDSIFRALDWLKRECLAPGGDSFVYTTAMAKRGEGQPDLNLLIVHAFGYGYKISGYKRTDYLELGIKIFDKGIKNAFLGDGKHFNQNYRSSGHFLRYIEDGGLTAAK